VTLDLGPLAAFTRGYRAPQVRHRLVDSGAEGKDS
jgi:hypothetical protein